MENKINLFFETNSSNLFRGIGIYSKELRKQLQKSPNINLGQSKSQADLIHYPDFNIFERINLTRLNKTIFTIHDLVPLDLPHLFPLGLKTRLAWWHNRHFLKKTLHIITDSIASKHQIIKHTFLPETHITVIYLAPRPSLLVPKTGTPFSGNFALYVGDVNPNKNLRKIVIACLTNNLPLLIVGKSAFQKNIHNLKHPELQDLIWLQKQSKTHPKLIKILGFVSDQKLSNLYQTATICLQPSLAEGFGLPVLEALALGCPVITSNLSSLSEVGGKSCTYINPNSQEELTQAVNKISHLSSIKRNKLVKQGKLHARQFTWEKTANQTIDLYKSLL